jgi:pseudouridine kinase
MKMNMTKNYAVQCLCVGDTGLDQFIRLDSPRTEASPSNPGNTDVCFELGAKIAINNRFENIGGNAANVAAGLKKLGIRAELYTFIGDDTYGHLIKKAIEQEQLTDTFVFERQYEHSNTAYILSLGNQRTILSYHADRTYEAFDLPEADWIFLTSMGKGSETIIEKVLHTIESRKGSTRLAFNPGSYFLKHQLTLSHQILPHTSVLFLNKEEAQAILQVSEEHIPHLIQQLLLLFKCEKVVLTDGTNGAYSHDRDEIHHIPALPFTPVEVTGAGDAFAAGYLAAHIRNLDVQECLKYGAVNSARTIQKIGSTQGQCFQDEMKQILENTIFPISQVT